jgi:competence protein ComEC
VPDSGNESSLAVLFRHEDCDILITGDRSDFGERMLLRTAQIPNVDILVAGHHGSKHSTSAQLLNATMPKIVVISVGENFYGHPAQEVLDRIAVTGAAIYRTDLHGNIILRR